VKSAKNIFKYDLYSKLEKFTLSHFHTFSKIPKSLKRVKSSNLGKKSLKMRALNKEHIQTYRKTSISPPWHSVFQPFPDSGVLLEVTFNERMALYFLTN